VQVDLLGHLIQEHDPYLSTRNATLSIGCPHTVGAPLEEAWDASLVLLTYVDESYTKERYFLAALLVPENEANSLTAALNGVATTPPWITGRCPQ
jgi:hypothetical protein